MKLIPGLAGALSMVAALSGLTATAHAATYNMTITTGTYEANDAILGEFSFPVDGRSLTATVSDTFQTLTYDYGHGFTETTLFKTLKITDVVHYTVSLGDTWNSLLYSKDGVHFFVNYYGYGPNSRDEKVTLTSSGLTFTGTHNDGLGSYTLNYTALVPVPGAAWLFGSSLAGLLLGKRRLARRG